MSQATIKKNSLRIRPAPKIGLVINSIGVFNPHSKDESERAIRDDIGRLAASGEIDSWSIITPRIFGPHEALAAADRFAEARVDLIVIANVAFPNGQVFATVATHPHLDPLPILWTVERLSEGGLGACLL